MSMSKGSRVAAFVLAAVLIAAGALPVFAAPQDDFDTPQEDAVTSLLTVQERLDAIESRKGESQAYLSELNLQLIDLTKQLNTLQKQYSEKRAELDLVSQQLTDAENLAAEQRENMALRIQYMYENSLGNGLLDAVFSGESFQDILTRSANIRELSEYDRRMLDEYVQVCEEIETKRQTVEKEQEEIVVLEDESLEKRTEIQTIYEETLADIREMSASIEEGREEETRLLASIREQEDQLAVLLVPAVQQVAAADQYALQAAAAAQPVQTAEAAGAAEKTGAEVSAETAQPAENAAGGAAAVADAAAGTASSGWNGSVLTRAGGVNQGPSGKETYYNLNMAGVVSIMRNMGNTDEYWVRDDGVKMLGDYVMVAADLETHPRGSIVESSLGEAIVVDTGSLEKEQLDIAVAW